MMTSLLTEMTYSPSTEVRGLSPPETLDMEYVLFMCRHIDNPCETEDGHNIRGFYIALAEDIDNVLK